MKWLKDEAGFSLMELILVIMILSVALLPLITQTVQTTIHATDGQAVSTATFLARERLEQVLADLDAPAVGYANILTARYPAESPVNGFAGYARATTVSADSSWSGLTYRSVAVTVTSALAPPVTLTTWVVQ